MQVRRAAAQALTGFARRWSRTPSSSDGHLQVDAAVERWPSGASAAAETPSGTRGMASLERQTTVAEDGRVAARSTSSRYSTPVTRPHIASRSRARSRRRSRRGPRADGRPRASRRSAASPGRGRRPRGRRCRSCRSRCRSPGRSRSGGARSTSNVPAVDRDHAAAVDDGSFTTGARRARPRRRSWRRSGRRAGTCRS